jgi:hypothetical protein
MRPGCNLYTLTQYNFRITEPVVGYYPHYKISVCSDCPDTTARVLAAYDFCNVCGLYRFRTHVSYVTGRYPFPWTNRPKCPSVPSCQPPAEYQLRSGATGIRTRNNRMQIYRDANFTIAPFVLPRRIELRFYG